MQSQEVNEGNLLIAWKGERPVGDVFLSRREPQKEVQNHAPHLGFLEHLEVDPNHRREGIGTALIDEGEGIARDLGHRRLAMGIDHSDPDASRLLAMYRRLGYQDWGHGMVPSQWDQIAEDGTKTIYRTELFIVVKTLG
jgi:GNAT superfamily N-acetyltransferase